MQAHAQQTFLDHLLELRTRLFYSAFTFFTGAVIGYLLNTAILAFLIKPLNQPLFYSSPAGGIDFIIKISLFFGFVLSIPVFTYNLLKFIEPVLSEHFQVFITRLLFASCLLTVSGILFAYFLSLPAALKFLGNFGSSSVRSLISATEYFSFVTTYIAGFAILFQLPLILFLINRVKPLNPKQLMKKQHYVLLGSFVIAGVLTPTPDIINQTIMALPLIALYQFSIFIIWLTNSSVSKSNSLASMPHRRSRLNRKKPRFFITKSNKFKHNSIARLSFS